MSSKTCKKPCDRQKICNPASGRCVLKSGKLGIILKPKSRDKSAKRHKSRSSKIKEDEKGFPFRERSPFIDSQFISEKQKNACTEDKLEISIQSKQEIIIPVRHLIDIENPHGFIENGIISSDPVVDTINLDGDDFGRGIMNFIEPYDFKEMDMGFFKRNIDFISSLTMREIGILSFYTSGGDQYANAALKHGRDGIRNAIDSTWHKGIIRDEDYTISIYYQLLDELNIEKNIKSVNRWLADQNRDEKFYAVIERCVGKYIAELEKIFEKAPKLTKNMHVFRGTKTFYYGTGKSDVFASGEFMSTSISPGIALNFTRDECCFTQIRLRPGMKVIFLEPVSQHWGELEILIPPKNKFKVFKDRIRKYVSVPNIDLEDSESRKYKNFACDDRWKKTVLFTFMESI